MIKEGILVEAGTALAPGAVSRIDPCGKYLIFFSRKGREALADKFGASFVVAVGVVCQTAPFSPEALAALAAQQLNALAQRVHSRLGLTLTAGAEVRDYVAAQCSKEKGAEGLADCCERIFRALSEYCLQTDAKLSGTVALTAAPEGLQFALNGAAPADLFSLLPAAYTGAVEQIRAELDALVGLAPVKEYVFGLADNLQVQQRRAAAGFKTASLSMHMIFTGTPGTGKTTTVNAILQLLENQAERVALCAPTGRAAKRLSELTGRKASTIHRLLEVDYTGGVVSFIHNDKNLLKCDVVILDEMSMVDVKLFQALIAALRYTCRIIMVGDADQLPSVGAGNILSEVIHSGCVPTVCLNEIFRQAKRSLIVENAHHIISGEPLQKGSKTDDFFFLEADGEAAQRLVCDLVTTRLPRSYGFDPIRDIQVLCPTKLGPTGTQALNVELQNLLSPPQKGKPQLQSAARVFRVGDKVMQVRNNYEIVWNRIGGEQGVGAYNGDIGIVESINLRERSMVVRMDDRRLLYPAENLNELEIAYAITVHKSQGSEFPAVILPVAQVPPRLCYRNLFYTGVTRARRLCVVAGRRDVVNSMMSNIRQNLRYSGLCALLQAGQPSEQLSTEGESP